MYPTPSFDEKLKVLFDIDVSELPVTHEELQRLRQQHSSYNFCVITEFWDGLKNDLRRAGNMIKAMILNLFNNDLWR